MNSAQLLDHFDRISEAPDAIPRLRRFILDLAVRGKLVDQDRRDEPASELLTRIQKEKEWLLKAGKLKLLEPSLVQLSDLEMPFSTPSSWAWAQLANISLRIHYGFTASANQFLKGVRLLRITDIQNNSVDWSSVPGCEITADEVTQYSLDKNDILIARTGGTIGKTFLVRQIPVTAVFASYLIRVQPSAELRAQYLKVFLESSIYWDQLQDGARGGGQPNVNGKTLGRMIVPIPPVAEQHRIVAKVDELMGLCDRLEAAQVERESRRDRLAAASLHRLNNGADADAFRDHARFYFNHLPRLTTKREHIQQLRQTILNLAVRGRLVPQDPSEEPVKALLKRTGSHSSDNEPFFVPASWAWVSVDQVADSRLGKMLDKAKNKGTAQRYLRNVNVRWFDFDLSNVLQMRFEDCELIEFALRKGDVLICEGGEPGRAAVWDEREMGIYFQKAIHRVRFPQGVAPHFFVNILRESANSGRLSGYFTGVGIKHFTGKGLSSFVFPLPPLAEQHRIVAKVDELMALCDRLETQLTTTQTESRRLLEALLHEALAPALKETA
jgi:type I restriction enzyme, S subunit